jgi:phosphoglycolate phosphatase
MTPLAIFDLDGTLVDSRHDLADAGNAARAAIGMPALPIEAVVAMIGDGAQKLIERLTPERDSDARASAMQAFRTDYAGRLTARTRAYSGIPELLAGLHGRGWRLAVATNKPSEFARPICERLGLPFDALRGGEGTKKPDPTMLLELMREAGATTASTWMIGDHRTDLLAAQRAGVRSVHCTWGFGSRDAVPATAEASHPSEILGILHA